MCTDCRLRHFSVCRFSCTAIILFISLLVVFQRRVILWAEIVVNQCTTREFTAVPVVPGAVAAWPCTNLVGLGVLESWSLVHVLKNGGSAVAPCGLEAATTPCWPSFWVAC